MVPVKRQQILDILIGGLQRLEYRGYDSAGLAIDGGHGEQHDSIHIIKQKGKVAALQKEILGRLWIILRVNIFRLFEPIHNFNCDYTQCGV